MSLHSLNIIAQRSVAFFVSPASCVGLLLSILFNCLYIKLCVSGRVVLVIESALIYKEQVRESVF